MGPARLLNGVGRLYLGLVLFFLYAPIVVMAAMTGVLSHCM